jgi:hypothetical protein
LGLLEHFEGNQMSAQALLAQRLEDARQLNDPRLVARALA